ncbi:MAG TPA: NADH-quinone oxidoreductase subunit M [Candidatus Nitrosopolaris sp.]|nr:NADH-quinone oxidoreductase subunit M [Candidatus Nitrosopolaris sp.]
MAESYFLLAATFMPLLLSPVAYFIGRRAGLAAVTWFSFGVLAISTGLLFVPVSMLNGGHTVYSETYPWGQFGNFGLRLDGLSLPFAIINYIWFTVLIIYSKPYINRKIVDEARIRFGGGHSTESTSADRSPTHGSDEQRRNDTSGGVNTQSGTLTTTTTVEMQRYVDSQVGLYFGLFLVFAMGTLGMVLANNLIEFYVFFELVLVPSFFLISFFGYGVRQRTGLMFFFWTHAGSVVLLLGLLSIGFFAGGFDYSTVRAHVSQIPAHWMPIIIFAVVLGLGVKMGGFLLHSWVPSSVAGAPTPVSILLVGIATYGILRIWLDLLGGNYVQYSLYLNIWGLATMIYGGAMALMQDDIRKVLAYSTISNMGYILFGLGSGSVLGVTGATLLYVTSGLGKAILFMMAGSINLQTGTNSLSKLGGLAGKMPYTAVLAMIGLLTLFGIPPTSGFMSEWILFNGVLQTGIHDASSLRIALFGFGLLTTVLSSAYLLWMYKRIFFGKLPQELVNVRDSGRYIIITMAALAGLTLIIGVYPDPFLTPITTYIQGMFHSPAVVPLPSSGASGIAVPLAKNIMFKSGNGFSSKVVPSSAALMIKINSGGAFTSR